MQEHVDKLEAEHKDDRQNFAQLVEENAVALQSQIDDQKAATELHSRQRDEAEQIIAVRVQDQGKKFQETLQQIKTYATSGYLRTIRFLNYFF